MSERSFVLEKFRSRIRLARLTELEIGYSEEKLYQEMERTILLAMYEMLGEYGNEAIISFDRIRIEEADGVMLRVCGTVSSIG